MLFFEEEDKGKALALNIMRYTTLISLCLSNKWQEKCRNIEDNNQSVKIWHNDDILLHTIKRFTRSRQRNIVIYFCSVLDICK